jgi:uncharacterized protein (DUF302 family)
MKKFISKLLMGNIVQKTEIDAAFNDVIQALEKAISDNQFAIQAIHDLKDTYVKKHLNLSDDFEYKIVQICNAPKSHKALTQLSYDMGIMMPKSIIVARENGKTTLRYMKFKPWMVSLMFPELDIAPLSKHVSEIMEKIVRETVATATAKPE